MAASILVLATAQRTFCENRKLDGRVHGAKLTPNKMSLRIKAKPLSRRHKEQVQQTPALTTLYEINVTENDTRRASEENRRSKSQKKKKRFVGVTDR